MSFWRRKRVRVQSSNRRLNQLCQLIAERFANNPVLADQAVTRLAVLLEGLDQARVSGSGARVYLPEGSNVGSIFLLVQELHRIANYWAASSRDGKRDRFVERVAVARAQYLARKARSEILRRRASWAAAGLAGISVFGATASVAGAADDLHIVEFPVELPAWLENVLWPDAEESHTHLAPNAAPLSSSSLTDRTVGSDLQEGSNEAPRDLEAQTVSPRPEAGAPSTQRVHVHVVPPPAESPASSELSKGPLLTASGPPNSGDLPAPATESAESHSQPDGAGANRGESNGRGAETSSTARAASHGQLVAEQKVSETSAEPPGLDLSDGEAAANSKSDSAPGRSKRSDSL
jgi:hypothetical protein